VDVGSSDARRDPENRASRETLQELDCGAQLGCQSDKGVVEHTLRKNPTSIIFFDHGLLDEFENRGRVLFLC
jgi:hypothetical protein